MRHYWYIPAAVLLVLAVVGFFAGWVQLSLGPDTWAVVFTTTRWFASTVINPSGFTWRWERLVPHGLTLYRITLTSEKTDLDIHAALPSADAYSALMPEKPDFSVDMKLSAIYRIRPEALPALVGQEGLRQENLGDWYEQMNAELARRATELAMSAQTAGAEGPGAQGQSMDAAQLAARLAKSLPGDFPRVQFASLSPVISKMPDAVLYAKLRSAYLGIVDEREKAYQALAPRQAQDEAAQRSALQKQEASIAILTRYGELLKKYPELIKFLFISSSQKLTARDLQTLDLLDKLSPLE